MEEKLNVLKESVVEKIENLKTHPRNYRAHPDDQLAHIEQSIRDFGVYRNVVVARDNTILAGHGVVATARKMGLEEITIIRLDVDPNEPRALKLLTGDNEISNLVESDDRLLSGLLKEIKDLESDSGLLGTGFNDMSLANLLFVTRPASEIENFDEAAHWVGMPEYEDGDNSPQLKISFESKEGRDEFVEKIGITKHVVKKGRTWSLRWPPEGRKDWSSIKFKQTDRE